MAATDDERKRAVEILEKLLTKLNERVDSNIESAVASKESSWLPLAYDYETGLFAEMRGDLAEAIALLRGK